MIIQMLGLTALSMVIGWASWQLIFKPLFREYNDKIGSIETIENEIENELNDLEAEIELDIKREEKIKQDKKEEILS